MTFQLYRLLLTLACVLPAVMLIPCGVLYVLRPKPNALGEMALLLVGILLGLSAGSSLGWVVPLIAHGGP